MKRLMLISVAVFVLFAVAAVSLSFGRSRAQAKESASLPVNIQIGAEQLSMQPSAEALVRYAGGWVLSSENEGFGGFSGLVINAEANTLVAISDKGDWWQASFDPGERAAPSGGTLRGYVAGAVADKVDLDAESLIRFRSGYLVSFEQNHRLEFVSKPGSKPEPTGLASIDFAGVSSNSGLEAMALLPSGDVLAFAERGRDVGGRLKTWLVGEDATANLYFKPPPNFAPTDAATLPNGDVVLLARKYSAIEGVAVKLLHIKAGDIQPGATLTGSEILHLTPEGPVDNMEGLDAVAVDADTVRLVMISDDNFNPLQRTLLMMFDYDYR